MERLNRSPERTAVGSSDNSNLSRFGRVTANVEIVIDLEQMFEKGNYAAFLAQSHASAMSDWTGVPLTVDEPIGEFAACVIRNGTDYEINLAFAGEFSSAWGKSDLLLIVNNEDDKRILLPGINEDEKLFFLVCSANPQKPHESVVVPFMATMEPWHQHGIEVPVTNIAYTMLFNAYLSTQL